MKTKAKKKPAPRPSDIMQATNRRIAELETRVHDLAEILTVVMGDVDRLKHWIADRDMP